MKRALVVQMARLGDLIQSIPAITAMKTADPSLILDLLCPAPLASVGRMIPDIAGVLEWDGAAWGRGAQEADAELRFEHVREAERRMCALATQPYECAYVLNQHPRALLAGALLARDSKSPRLDGPLGERLSPWASYVRDVALTRRSRRVHLADAFCGLCGIYPPGKSPAIRLSQDPLPAGLEPIGKQGGPWIALIVGAGAAERLVPLDVWRGVIARFLEASPDGRVVLLGQERERGRYLQDLLPSSMLGRVWDVTGRTTLPELAKIVARCHTVVGADTGPLHLAAAAGVRVIGWYFAHARVHETGPYGTGHLIWQAENVKRQTSNVTLEREDPLRIALPGTRHVSPLHWPIEETITALTGGEAKSLAGWTAWTSHCDRWGAYYSEAGGGVTPPHEREELWHELCPALG
jgi:ADP-heptose:LPS heptosyltransferase